MNLSVESVEYFWWELEKLSGAYTRPGSPADLVQKKLNKITSPKPPAVPKVKTAMAVEDMQRGDIIVASPGPPHERATVGNKFQDWLFTKASPYWQGLFTHAGIYVGDGKTIEAYPKGIIKRPVNKLLKGRSYVVVRPKATDIQREKAAQFAESQLGKPYSKLDLMRASLRTMLPASAATLVGGAPGIPKKKNAKGYQCGGLVAASYAAAKAPLNNKINPRYSPPTELLFGERSEIVGRKMRRGHVLNAPKGRAMRAPWLKKMNIFDTKRKQRRREQRELKKVAQPVGQAYPGTRFSQDRVTPDLTRTNREAMRLAAEQARIPKALRKTKRGTLHGALLALKRAK